MKRGTARWAENKAILGVKDKKYIVSGLPFLIFGGKCYPVKRRIARWAENKKGRKQKREKCLIVSLSLILDGCEAAQVCRSAMGRE